MFENYNFETNDSSIGFIKDFGTGDKISLLRNDGVNQVTYTVSGNSIYRGDGFGGDLDLLVEGNRSGELNGKSISELVSEEIIQFR